MIVYSSRSAVVLLLLLTLFVAGCGGGTSDQPREEEPRAIPSGFTLYNNRAEGISFIYPESWSDQQDPESIISIGEKKKVVLGVRVMTEANLDQFDLLVGQVVDQLHLDVAISQITPEQGTVGGLPASIITYQQRVVRQGSEEKVLVLRMMLVKDTLNNRILVLIFSAPQDLYQGYVDSVLVPLLNSLKIIAKGGVAVPSRGGEAAVELKECQYENSAGGALLYFYCLSAHEDYQTLYTDVINSQAREHYSLEQMKDLVQQGSTNLADLLFATGSLAPLTELSVYSTGELDFDCTVDVVATHPVIEDKIARRDFIKVKIGNAEVEVTDLRIKGEAIKEQGKWRYVLYIVSIGGQEECER